MQTTEGEKYFKHFNFFSFIKKVALQKLSPILPFLFFGLPEIYLRLHRFPISVGLMQFFLLPPNLFAQSYCFYLSRFKMLLSCGRILGFQTLVLP